MRYREIISETEIWHGKNVVQQIGPYRIAVDSPGNATYVTVWDENNKRIGSLSTRGVHLKFYLGIARAEIEPKYRGKGLGKAMYRALLTNINPEYKGIASYLPDRSNKKQVPKIYKSLGGGLLKGNEDYMVIPRTALSETTIPIPKLGLSDPSKPAFSTDFVISGIAACQKHFDEGYLFHGNCGAFAIALSKWMSESFSNADFGMMAPVVVFGSATSSPEVSMIENAVDYNHVFAFATVGGKRFYFDGTGLVSKENIAFWYKDTLKWYKESEFDYGPGRGRVVAAVGSINSESAIMCVESGTDPFCDSEYFLEYLRSLNNKIKETSIPIPKLDLYDPSKPNSGHGHDEENQTDSPFEISEKWIKSNVSKTS